MSERRLTLRTLIVPLAVIALGLQVRPVGQPQNGPATPRFRTDVNYVRLDVYASTKGAPVLDLTRDEFEVREEGVPQAIDAFERIDIAANGQSPRAREPNTLVESRDLLQGSRARVFVIFLDVPHVTEDVARSMGPRLAKGMDGLVGPDDLVGLMTPDMKATDVTFGRGRDTVASILARGQWGERGGAVHVTPQDQLYQSCYPGLGPTPACADDDRGVADEMIARRQERDTLAALDDLVSYLRTARDERKAVLVVSDGWRLYRANNRLERSLNCQSPLPQIGVDPRTGRVTTQAGVGTRNVNLTRCEIDRMALANLDNNRTFRSMLNRANRANVSFYALDPRGVVVFDTPIDQVRTGRAVPGDPTIPSVITDAARLSGRQGALRDLAAATDGLAILNSNDVESGFRRIAADLSSYYLLGYYSTGTLDGRFHQISVRVKRPGVDVRARPGYEAARANDVTAAAAAIVTKPDVLGGQIANAMADLAVLARGNPVAVSVSSGWVAPATAQWWISGELATTEMWRAGAEVTAMLSSASGDAVATGRTSLAAGIRSFRLAIQSGAVKAGDYRVTLRVQPKEPGTRSELAEASAPLLETPRAHGAVISRRGATSGRIEIPAVAGRFRRADTIRVDVLEVESSEPSARILDRTGRPLSIPLNVEHVQDNEGVRWASVQLALAPLAPGDYLVELTQPSRAVASPMPPALVAFRVVP
jgi:VWFA-related protein